MSIKWPESMPEGGRLSQSKNASQRGKMLVADPKMSCPRTLHVTLFFDGTNNNDAEENKVWRDSKVQAHTNVARLFNAAIDSPEKGMFVWYIPGVGTPFSKIGEDVYTQGGKALAAGFDNRCVWAYTRLLNSVYSAIITSKKQLLLSDEQARKLCDEHTTVVKSFEPVLHRLDVAHTQAVDEGRYPETVRQVWVNVIGFSRGAAEARAFVHKLIKEWAPGGKLGAGEGKYALPYTVNFMGLFDTVAAVGLPDSVRSIFNVGAVAGHSTLSGVFKHGGMAFAANGAMNIPDEVRYCRHAFSIHEQRMSFALDSIRMGQRYSDDDFRVEVAYPGVHSDVGGGYGPGEQGKAFGSDGKGRDACKLSQISLHDMYVAALEQGVPLMTGDAILKRADLAVDFEIDSTTIEKFNAWRAATPGIDTLEDAMRFGMSQLLAWRTLRAQIGTGYYVTERDFYRRAQEDAKSPLQVRDAVEQARKTDPQYRDLTRQIDEAYRKNRSGLDADGPYMLSQMREFQAEIKDLEAKQKKRIEELTGEIAHPNAPSDVRPNTSRPGEAPEDIAANDKRDLRYGAEEMRLLLGYLNPEQRPRWEIDRSLPVEFPRVKHAAPSDSPEVSMVERGLLSRLNGGHTLAGFSATDDFVLQPVQDVLPFMRESTSDEAVAKLLTQHDVVALYDDFVHDSRCWFKVPWFREYAPGGYFWPRVVFIGNDERARWLGIDPLKVAVELNSDQGVDSSVDVNRVEIA
jgi:hypothetical protein